jgi:hypothetical protein
MSGDLTSDLGERVHGGRGRRSLTIGTRGPSLTYRSMSGDLHVLRVQPVQAPASPSAPSGPDVASVLVAPVAAAAPVDPAEPSAPAAVVNGAIAAAYEGARLRILQALERREIDVAEAGRRFEALDAADPVDPSSDTTRVPTVDRSDA